MPGQSAVSVIVLEQYDAAVILDYRRRRPGLWDIRLMAMTPKFIDETEKLDQILDQA